MIEYIIEDFSVLYINGRRLNFRYKIEKVFDRGDTLIVFLGKTVPKKEFYPIFYPSNGIYALSPNGEYLWNIEVFFRPGHALKGVKVLPVYRFVDADIDQHGNLVVHTDMGVGYILDIKEKQIVGYFKSKQRPINVREQTIPYLQTSETVLEINGRELDFSYRIERIIELNNMLIINLDSTRRSIREQPENGVYGISPDGEILWNIEEFFRPDDVQKYGLPIEFYESISLDDDGRYLEVDTYYNIEHTRIRYTLDVDKKQVVKRVVKKKKGI